MSEANKALEAAKRFWDLRLGDTSFIVPADIYKIISQSLARLSELEGVIQELVEASAPIAKHMDCDCPDEPDEDSIGWEGITPMELTFGQLRRFNKGLVAANRIAKIGTSS